MIDDCPNHLISVHNILWIVVYFAHFYFYKILIGYLHLVTIANCVTSRKLEKKKLEDNKGIGWQVG